MIQDVVPLQNKFRPEALLLYSSVHDGKFLYDVPFWFFQALKLLKL